MPPPQGRAQETLWGLRNKLFAMFKIQQISPRNVLKRGTPKCIFPTLLHHLHIYFFLAYLDFKNMFSFPRPECTSNFNKKKTNKQQQIRLSSTTTFPQFYSSFLLLPPVMQVLANQSKEKAFFIPSANSNI